MRGSLLTHSPYSPHLAPSDYYLFSSLFHFLDGKKFERPGQNFFGKSL